MVNHDRGIQGLLISPALHRVKERATTKSGSRMSLSGLLLEHLPNDFVLDFVKRGSEPVLAKISLHHLSPVLSKPVTTKGEEVDMAFKRIWPPMANRFVLKETPCSVKVEVEDKMKENNDQV